VTDEPEDTGRRRYFDLQSLARRQGRNTQELLTLYALEGLLARLAHTEHARTLVLKGGMLLAAFDQRHPTRDLDMHAGQVAGDVDTIRQVVVDLAEVSLDDGLVFWATSPNPLRASASGPSSTARWRRKQDLTDRLPASFDDVVREVIEFADLLLTGNLSAGRWDPAQRRWAATGSSENCIGQSGRVREPAKVMS